MRNVFKRDWDDPVQMMIRAYVAYHWGNKNYAQTLLDQACVLATADGYTPPIYTEVIDVSKIEETKAGKETHDAWWNWN